MKSTLTIRAENEDLAAWTKAANLRGMSISEWVRRALTFVAQTQPEQGDNFLAKPAGTRLPTGQNEGVADAPSGMGRELRGEKLSGLGQSGSGEVDRKSVV